MRNLECHKKLSSYSHKQKSRKCSSPLECKNPICTTSLPYPVYDAYPIPATPGMIYVAKVTLLPRDTMSPVEKPSRFTASSELSCSDTFCAPSPTFSDTNESSKDSIEYRSLCYV